MEEKEVIKICNNLFNNEIRKARINWQTFNYKKYERELYHSAIKSFRIGFIKKLKNKLEKNTS